MSKEIPDYEKPGYRPPVRCHKCGMYKTEGDPGVEMQFETEGKERPNRVVTVWFNSQECKDIWIENNRDKVVRIIE